VRDQPSGGNELNEVMQDGELSKISDASPAGGILAFPTLHLARLERAETP
jgi:hypothetical protein